MSNGMMNAPVNEVNESLNEAKIADLLVSTNNTLNAISDHIACIESSLFGNPQVCGEGRDIKCAFDMMVLNRDSAESLCTRLADICRRL